ncbi:HipA domain-containing protein [Rhodoflexus sp.]
MPYTLDDMEQMAVQSIARHIALSGVQPKLSLELEKKTQPGRLTIVGLWGNYILKPPHQIYPQLPEIEDLTMKMAAAAGISTVPHSLIYLQSGELAYITRRIDRTRAGKQHMEDFCQLTENLTEHKYRGSYEQIAKAIKRFSTTPGLDIVNFFEQVLFSFLTGNADMHLKNFSLIYLPDAIQLSPAYDMVATALVNPADSEELALTLNGKKRKIKASDFESACRNSGMTDKQYAGMLNKMMQAYPKWLKWIEQSFLQDTMKQAYKDLLIERCTRLHMLHQS